MDAIRAPLQGLAFLTRRFLKQERLQYVLGDQIVKLRLPGEVRYSDRWGYAGNAGLGDKLEVYRFIGMSFLSREARRHVRPGDWAIDVGANIGAVTAELCSLTGERGHVWAIEPIPSNLSRLQELKELNQLKYLTIFEGALSNKTGSASIRLPQGGGSAYASFTKSYGTEGEIDVPVWRLDDLVFDAGYSQPVAFLKIDVEGFEFQVLEGAERTLREMRPLVYCEFNDVLLRDAGASSVQLLRRFADLGYFPVGAPAELDGKVIDLLLVRY